MKIVSEKYGSIKKRKLEKKNHTKRHYPCHLALPAVPLTLSSFGRVAPRLTFDVCPISATGPSVRKAAGTFTPVWGVSETPTTRNH